MDKLKAMATFIAIAERGSLSAAAEALGKSPPALVRTLANIEKQLGVRLLNRSTRHIALTLEGQEYLEHARQITSQIQAFEAQLEHRRGVPSGKLAVTAPVMFGRLHLAPLINQWLKQNPTMRVELALMDRVVDVIEEGFDLALRIGHLADSSLVARPVGETPYVLCASPAFLAQHGEPEHPSQLADWPTIALRPRAMSGCCK